jgi:tellurite resistance protein
MSELKVYHHELRHNEYEEFYIKSEADKVIADLEESHKKEVGQLLIEIAGLKADYKEACDRLQTANLIKDEQLAATRHQKYKRCLAMANYWVAVSYHCVDDKHRQKAEKRHYKWLELAEKFKETK